MRLGYCVVTNCSADDQQATMSKRLAQEKAFFDNLGWCEIAELGRSGIGLLKTRHRDLHMGEMRKECPHVKADVAKYVE